MGNRNALCLGCGGGYVGTHLSECTELSHFEREHFIVYPVHLNKAGF